MIDPRWIPLGYQQLTSMSSATPLTVPAGTTLAIFKAEAQSVRWRDDGTAPTATVGMLLATTDTPIFYYGTIVNLQFIQATAGAILNVTYYK